MIKKQKKEKRGKGGPQEGADWPWHVDEVPLLIAAVGDTKSIEPTVSRSTGKVSDRENVG